MVNNIVCLTSIFFFFFLGAVSGLKYIYTLEKNEKKSNFKKLNKKELKAKLVHKESLTSCKLLLLLLFAQ